MQNQIGLRISRNVICNSSATGVYAMQSPKRGSFHGLLENSGKHTGKV